jgi:murein DD-endopeptidase MepM/ murein hydrolase activator NlpD
MQSSKLNSNKSKLVKTVVSFVVTLSLVLTCFSANLLSAGAASYREKINELESKQAKVKEQINSLKSDIGDQEKLKDALQDEINTVQAQIDVYNGQLTEVENRLSEIEAQKEQKQNDLENTKQTFMTRLRAMYVSGDNSMLNVLLSANDFGDFLYRDQLLSSVTDHDNAIMEQLKADIKAVEELETQANEEKQEIQSIKSEVDAKRAELGDRMKEMNAVISELEGQKSGLEDQLDEYAAAIDEFEAKIQAEAAAAAKNNNSSASQSPSYSGGAKPNAGGWVWPCPGFYYISSYVGPRWGRTHNGLDIAGGSIYGKPIVAARAGTVIDAGWNSGGYGNYVMINHGDGFITIYGHMSSVAAYNGQSVSAGQVIGYVGNSGRSTGPHLHFEVRLNGSVEDPLDYVSR